MAVQDIKSNFESKGVASFSGQDVADNAPGVNTSTATIQQDMSIGSTLYAEVLITVPLFEVGAVINNVEWRFTDDDPSTTTFNQFNDLTNINTKSVAEDPNNPLGNPIVDLLTGLPIVFPYDLDTLGNELVIAAQVINPLGTFRYAFLHIEAAAATPLNPMMGTSLRGPLRLKGVL